MMDRDRIPSADDVYHSALMHKNSFNALDSSHGKDMTGLQIVRTVIRLMATIGYVLCDILRELSVIRGIASENRNHQG